MKKLSIILASLVSCASLAGGNHFHPKKIAKCGETCTEAQIKEAVPAAMKELINWRQVESQWETAKVEAVVKKEFTKGSKTLKTWVATLIDEKEKDSTKNKRYVFFTEDGLVFKINTTGELK